MNIIQIVGYKNSGKTTLVTKLIEALTGRGMHTAALKHHGHGGLPLGIENTDSYKHQKAGAIVAGVEGDGMLQLQSHRGWELEELIKIYELFEIEVLVVEGFKRANFPKIVLIRNETDLVLLEQLENIIAVVSAVPIVNCPYPLFSNQEFEGVCQFYIDGYVVER